MNFSVIPAHFKFFAPFVILSFILAFAIFPFYIKKLKYLQWGQQIREEGPQDHLSKKGTPTMGGLAIVFVFAAISAALWFLPIIPEKTDGNLSLTYDYVVFSVIVFLNAALGFFDDYLKIKKCKSLGLRARDKMLAHIIMSAGIAYYMICYSSLGSSIFVPFLGYVDIGWFLYPFCMLVLPGCVNAVNLTDGLDGLAGINVVISLSAFCLIMLFTGRLDLCIGSIIIIGSLIAFLWFNAFPAKIFMGDTGSLALGGALAALSILTGTEIILCVIGGVYVMEALSVMIQVTYFKITKGKRFFKMSPIHHHFALGGTHEVQVTARFAIISFILAIAGLYLYFGI